MQHDTLSVPPMDRHNHELLANVHPPGWRNPEPADGYNLVVIGAGTAGLVSAAAAAGLGAKVALVERHLMGGDCLNVGCVPSKTLIRSSRAAAEAASAERFGVRIDSGITVDFPYVMERMRRIRAAISRHDSAKRFADEYGVDVFLGEGRFTGPRTAEVDGKRLRFTKAVIAAGARPVHPAIEGLVEAGFVTNETVFSLTELPRRLIVIGGGPLGCELAQAFRRFGSEVTIVETAPQFLPREDPDAAAILADQFRREGITVLLNTAVARVGVSTEHKALHIRTEGRETTAFADEILVGVGRAPNVERLGLEAAGVHYDTRRGVVADDRLRTTNPHIYAAGDVCMDHKFTHAADAAARLVVQNALFFGRRKLSRLTIPRCTYTEPEIAHVGLDARDACNNGIPVDTLVRPLRDVDRAVTDGEEDGFVKIHLKQGTDTILGATIVARHAGEIISEIAVAMAGGMGLRSLSAVIHPYPTQAEAIRHLADTSRRALLKPWLRKLFQRFFAFRR